jgi:hypothetical protein
LSDGLLTSSPYETHTPVTGTYDFGIVAVDSSGNASLVPRMIYGVIIGDGDYTDAQKDTTVAANYAADWTTQLNTAIATALASNAQNAADNANAQLAVIADDAVLSRYEKPAVLLDYNAILAQQPGLVQAANRFSVSTAAFTAAITALTAYLNSLTPRWYDTGTDTAIVPATFRQKFIDVYSERQTVETAIATASHLMADSAEKVASTAQTAAVTAFETVHASVMAEGEARIAADGAITAKYTVKVDANGYIAGYGLIATDNNGVTTSDFTVNAARFSIGAPSGPDIPACTPFAVITTPTTINGITVAPGVYMDGAYMKTASIGTLMLAGNSVTQVVVAPTATTQVQIPNAAGVPLTSAQVTVTGAQPILVWASCLAAGAHIGTSSNYDLFYDGNYWKLNSAYSNINLTIQFTNNINTAVVTVQLAPGISVAPGVGTQIAAQIAIPPFTLPPGPYTAVLLASMTADTAVGIRYASIAFLDAKR